MSHVVLELFYPKPIGDNFCCCNFLRFVFSLSLRWHLSRKTGEVLRMVDRGNTSINNLLR